MSDSSHHSRSSAGRVSTFLLPGIVLLPVLYILSYGPVVTLAVRGLLGPTDGPLMESLEIFYVPLGLCLEAVPALEPALEWYINLWIG